jgi:hypothetical protein
MPAPRMRMSPEDIAAAHDEARQRATSELQGEPVDPNMGGEDVSAGQEIPPQGAGDLTGQEPAQAAPSLESLVDFKRNMAPQQQEEESPNGGALMAMVQRMLQEQGQN